MLVIKNGTLISMAGIYKEKYDVAVENGKLRKLKRDRPGAGGHGHRRRGKAGNARLH